MTEAGRALVDWYTATEVAMRVRERESSWRAALGPDAKMEALQDSHEASANLCAAELRLRAAARALSAGLVTGEEAPDGDKPVQMSGWVEWEANDGHGVRSGRRVTALAGAGYASHVRLYLKAWRRAAAAETVERAYRWVDLEPRASWPEKDERLAILAARVAATAERLRGGGES